MSIHLEIHKGKKKKKTSFQNTCQSRKVGTILTCALFVTSFARVAKKRVLRDCSK